MHLKFSKKSSCYRQYMCVGNNQPIVKDLIDIIQPNTMNSDGVQLASIANTLYQFYMICIRFYQVFMRDVIFNAADVSGVSSENTVRSNGVGHTSTSYRNRHGNDISQLSNSCGLYL